MYIWDPNQGSFVPNIPVAVAAALTINQANQAAYNGKVITLAAAQTITLAAGLPLGFSLTIIPPASGNASIASSGGVLLNGATTTLTRAAANIIVNVVNIGIDSFAVNGS